MEMINCPDQCTPYSHVDEIYENRRYPEFGYASSPWRFELSEWSFFHADNRDLVPIGFAEENVNFPDWSRIRIPSVWQQLGYGPSPFLQYDRELSRDRSDQGFLKRRMAALSSAYKDDDVGVYRTWVKIPEYYLDRSIFLFISGICGRFDVYINGEKALSSDPVFSPKKIPLSKHIRSGDNLITILVYRFHSVVGGIGKIEGGTLGFSGIFRSVSIIADALLEIRSLSVQSEWTGSEYGKDATLYVKTSLFNHTDISVPFQLEYKLIRAVDEYDIYNLPEIRLRTSDACEGTIEAMSTTMIQCNLLARDVSPWSHSTPSLYDLVVIVKDNSGRVLGVQKRKIGFRCVKEVDGKVFINDAFVPLKASRYFMFDPRGAIAVPPEQMLRDILLMKRAHLNTVLMTYFPADPQFFDLCDRYGIYVICPIDPSDPYSSIISFRTHPCVIVWSAKIHSKDEPKIREIREVFGAESGTDLIYCLSVDTGLFSGVDPFGEGCGTLFGEWQDICLDRQFLLTQFDPEHPQTEYQKLVANKEKRNFRYIHQADLSSGKKSSEIAIAQGIVDAERNPHPEYESIRKRCETVLAVISPEDPSSPVIVNTDLHGFSEELEARWTIRAGMNDLVSGIAAIGSLSPGSEREIKLGFRPEIIGDFLLDASNVEKPQLPPIIQMDMKIYPVKDHAWARKGYVEASFRKRLSEHSGEYFEKIELRDKNESRQVREEGDEYIVSFGAVTAVINKTSGGISDYSIGDAKIFAEFSEPFLYRASTNDERRYPPVYVRPRRLCGKRTWRQIQSRIRLEKLSYRDEEGVCVFHAQYTCRSLCRPMEAIYRFFSDGRAEITLSLFSRVKPPRYGFRFKVPFMSNRFRWLGNESGFIGDDAKAGDSFGLFESRSEALFHHYARPSENGVIRAVKMTEVVSKDNTSLLIRRADGSDFSFAATPYHPDVIDDSRHDEQLPTPEGANLFLDFEYEAPRGVSVNKSDYRSGKLRCYRGTFVLYPVMPDQEPI